ncbi:hypothetical protein YC2023_011367 [Brassica napus]
MFCSHNGLIEDQCFETRSGPAVGPVNPVIEKISGLGFVKKPIFRNPQKPTKTRNPIPTLERLLYRFLDKLKIIIIKNKIIEN